MSVAPANETHQILVVEDESEIRELIDLHLRREGLRVDSVSSVEEARQLMAKNQYALLALDWMLPGESGVELARSVRLQHTGAETAILMVTAKAEAHDIVAGLEAGADDYLTKPFDPSVLLARVRALLRRNRPGVAGEKSSRIQLGALSIDSETYEVRCGSEPLQLTPSEFKLLLTLAQNRGRVLTRDSLIEHVQGEGVSVVGRTVDTHVFGLRKKLGDCADLIETVRGVGYRVKPNET